MNPDTQKWYFRTDIFIVAFLCVGPFALPLVWMNPRYSAKKKMLITILTLIASYLVFVMLARSTAAIYNYYNQLLQLSR